MGWAFGHLPRAIPMKDNGKTIVKKVKEYSSIESVFTKDNLKTF